MQFADDSEISVKYILIWLLIKHLCFEWSFISSLLIHYFRDKTKGCSCCAKHWQQQWFSPPPCLKFMTQPTRVSQFFQSVPVVNTTWEAVHVQFLIRKLILMIIPIAREGSNTKWSQISPNYVFVVCIRLPLWNLFSKVCFQAPQALLLSK